MPPADRFRHALVRLVAPAALAVLLSAAAVWLVIIPATEAALMERKRELLRAIVASAHSQLERFDGLVRSGALTLAEAQARASAELRATRYGQEGKDYLWVIDRTPRMVMHPYLPELEGRELGDYHDADGKALFSAAIAAVAEDGDGYVDYRWQWQDDPHRVVPKLSYVRLFQPWGWVVGSGLYLEDVRHEIHATTSRLAWSGAGVALLVALLLLVAVRQGWLSERRRRQAEAELAQAHARSEALAHASSEAVWLLEDGRIAAANRVSEDLLGGGAARPGADAATLFADPADRALAAGGAAGPRSVLLAGAGGPVPALVTANPVIVHGREALVLTARSLAGDAPAPAERERREAAEALNDAAAVATAALLAPVAPLAIPVPRLPLTATPAEVGRALHEAGGSAALLTAPDGGVAGLVTAGDLARRGGATAYEAMSAPVRGLPGDASLATALDAMSETGAGRLLIPGDDGTPRLLGATRLLAALRQGPAQLAAAADRADQAGLAQINRRLAAWMASLARVGLDPELAAGEGSRIADAALRRCIALTLEEMGPPPAACSLLAVGSQGRRELLPGADQDNALVFADGADPAWFRAFGRALTARYHAAGWPRCHGGCTAGDERWCLPLGQWRERFAGWIRHGAPQDLLETAVFFDFRPVWGESQLADALAATVRDEVAARPVFALQLAKEALAARSPLGLFGGIRPDDARQGTIDLKLAMLQATGAVRVAALRHGLSATGTGERLRRLAAGGHLGADLAAEALAAWRHLLGLRLAARCRPGGGDQLDPATLAAWDLALLKRALAGIEALRDKLRGELARAGA